MREEHTKLSLLSRRTALGWFPKAGSVYRNRRAWNACYGIGEGNCGESMVSFEDGCDIMFSELCCNVCRDVSRDRCRGVHHDEVCRIVSSVFYTHPF